MRGRGTVKVSGIQYESWIAMGAVVAASRSEDEIWRVHARHLPASPLSDNVVGVEVCIWVRASGSGGLHIDGMWVAAL